MVVGPKWSSVLQACGFLFYDLVISASWQLVGQIVVGPQMAKL